ncbi:uncharacterized protein Pyn_15068 [Prunus yedoensis var. nudiflora]|uniref:Uncharacterized protein n=1 Tax=Prunus yedoensis var. nudiflora TaxID=2094558 RepID=A0A314ZNQ9_PRUYE|nr:uncharacterized protein Pyn_15068 [Prunus yedoensis var. nudiflora]
MDGFGNDVVAEDIAVKDADRYSDDLLVISAGQHLRSLRHGICKPFSEGCSSSSKPCISDRNPRTCERRASEPTEDTRSETWCGGWYNKILGIACRKKASVEHNAWELKQYIEELTEDPVSM